MAEGRGSGVPHQPGQAAAVHQGVSVVKCFGPIDRREFWLQVVGYCSGWMRCAPSSWLRRKV